MDQGPVDAGPSGDIDYNDNPTRTPSPDDGRGLRPPRQQQQYQPRFRSASSRRRRGGGGDAWSSQDFRDDYRPASGASSQRHSDGSPQPSAAAATAQEDLPGASQDADFASSSHTLAADSVTADGHHEELKEKSAGNEDFVHQADASRVYKFTLYETNARYWITGADLSENVYRLLRIDRTSPPGQIGLFEDETTYSLNEMNAVLRSIDEGNQATGGLRKRYQFWGVLGFIRFTEAYYMLVITKRQQVAMIGGHYVYQIESTELVPLTTGASSRFVRDRNPEETRFLNIFNSLDLSKGFYFSYAYDVTNSLQHNIIRQREAINSGLHQADVNFNSMFVWNHHLLKPAMAALKHPFVWCLPIIHGFIDQASLDIFGRAVYITIIGRRSRFFAGARFLKRGVNDQGYVANDVETEQIVAEKLSTSFHAPGGRLYSNPTYTSFLHHRGSIPLYWTQDSSGVSPKPDINLNLVDPFYEPAALHFDNLFERYGGPVYVLNLIKSRERTPRESKLLVEFQKCIGYLNQSLPADKKILYKAFDMSRASKTRGGDVIGHLEIIAKEIVAKTGFFRNGDEHVIEPQVQNGVARTNCIDCLDRTNAAQFVLGKHAFALQLQALGVIDRDEVDYDTDAANVFTHMFHDHGDTIAVQYGGSHLVNTMATYRKLNHWQSSSRDMVESFKRYYHNSFLDNQRQEAYNLFLGNYIWAQGLPMLWDLTTDYYLHHNDPRGKLEQQRRNFIGWYTAAFLEPKSLPPTLELEGSSAKLKEKVDEYDEYWTETYRPAMFSTLGKVYSFRMLTSNRFIPERTHRDAKYDYSPFKIRVDPHRQSASLDTPEKRAAQRKGVKILEPEDTSSNSAQTSRRESQDVERGLHEPPSASEDKKRKPTSSILRDTLPLTRTLTEPAKHSLDFDPLNPMTHSSSQYHHHRAQSTTTMTAENAHGIPSTLAAAPNGIENGTTATDKAQQHTRALNFFYTQSLHPAVSDKEAREYNRYISHPLHLPLVISSELPSDANRDFVEYVHKAGGAGAAGPIAAPVASVIPSTSNSNVNSNGSAQRPRPATSAGPGTLSRSATAGVGGIGNTGHTSDFTRTASHHHHHHHHDSHQAPNHVGFDIGPAISDEDLHRFWDFLRLREDPLTVQEEDVPKKRYKAYRQWLKGKSLFKQSKVDPEFTGSGAGAGAGDGTGYEVGLGVV